jgi:uncharacterized damage-inducible protein DinB
MANDTKRLDFVYDGWDGYHRAIVQAVEPLTPEQLAFRSTPDMRSVGEVAWHIADGRVDWFSRMAAPGAAVLARKAAARNEQQMDAKAIVAWLEESWQMIAHVLDTWTVDDLTETFRQPYGGQVYAVSRQWVVWRIMCHDIHHGGQLSELLALQSILPEGLTLLGGHLTEPPLAD